MKIRLKDQRENTVSDKFHSSNETNIYNQSDIGQALQDLNNTTIIQGEKNSEIDLRARLHPIEVSNLLALDSLVAIGFLPTQTLALSIQKKRLSVSINGLGRKEIIEVVSGDTQRHERKSGFFTNLMGANK